MPLVAFGCGATDSCGWCSDIRRSSSGGSGGVGTIPTGYWKNTVAQPWNQVATVSIDRWVDRFEQSNRNGVVKCDETTVISALNLVILPTISRGTVGQIAWGRNSGGGIYSTLRRGSTWDGCSSPYCSGLSDTDCLAGK